MTRLTAMMGSYPRTQPLKDKTVTSPLVELDFAPIDVAQKGFKGTVRELKYDVSELALMTFLIAYDHGKPYVLLPFVMNGGHHHKSILCPADSDLRVEDLAGKTVAMRSYSQTTPTWARGILAAEYGVNLADVRWVTQEGSHVAEYDDPPGVIRSQSGRSLPEMLAAGEADAIIAGSGVPDGLRTLIPDSQDAAQRWQRETGVMPINHMVAVRRELAPDIVAEVLRLLRVAGDQPPLNPEVLRLGIRFAHEQGLIRKEYPVEELVRP